MKNTQKYFVLFFFLTFSFALFAQQRQIKGTVKDEKGEAIIGATIIVKGSAIGTTTDFDGNFTLSIPASAKILQISYVGMDKKEVDVKSNDFNIVLKDNSVALNEVVAIGYGTQRKRDLTGSVASVSDKVLKDIPVSSAAEALTGKLPGVQVTTTEGSPDAEIKIRVRGGGSITQSNTPLYIVDGFQMDDISSIAPSEIQSIDVLKDASSTAIYGSQGANGVIIITTKSGKEGKVSVSYNGYTGIKEIAKYLKVLSPYQFAQKQYERAVWDTSTSSTAIADDYEAYFGSYNDINLYNYMNGANWQKQVFGRTGTTQSNSLTLSGGTKTESYNINYNRMDEKEIMLMSDFHRNTASIKLNLTPLNWIKGEFAARYSQTIVDGGGANSVNGIEKSPSDSRVKNAVIYTPIPLLNSVTQLDYDDATSSICNPLQSIADNDRYQNTQELTLNGGVTITPTKNLTIMSSVGYFSSTKRDDQFFGLTTYYVQQGGALKNNNNYAPACFLTNTYNGALRNSNTVSYRLDNFVKNNNLNFMVGEENSVKTDNYVLSDVEGFPAGFTSQMAWELTSQGTTRSTQNYYYPNNVLESYFGRVSYDYKQRYLFNATFRADGSSLFATGHQWGYFPAAAAAWRISDEDFMKNAQRWLSNLKLRLSFGEAGNNNITSAAYARNYYSSVSNYLPSSISSSIWTDYDPTLTTQILSNSKLKWETTITRNAGLDYGFFNNRLSGTIDAYRNTTKDLLLQVPTDGTGYTSQWQNVGSTRNQGAELSLSAVLIQHKDFSLDFNFNISTNSNRVESLGGLSSMTFNENWTSQTTAMNSYTITVGQPTGLIYGYKSDGMYTANDFTWNGNKWVAKPGVVDNSAIDGLSWGPGAMKLKDLDGDGKITSADRTIIGNTNPKNFGSFSFTANYKGFDATINCNWVYGNSIYNANKIEMSSEYYKYRNMLASTLNSYTQINWTTGARVYDAATLTAMNAGATTYASPTGAFAITSDDIENGSFLRLSNLTVGYSLPKKLVSKWYIQQFRIYVSAYNLYTLTKYSGYDPEVDSRRATPETPGVDYSAYPKSRTYNIGVNVNF
jgi:TonB-linked SusC/RagA family outer membrane protein